MATNTWINEEDYLIWLWETSHEALQRCPFGTRPFAEAAVHALLASLRELDTVTDLRAHYQYGSPATLALIRSLLPIGPGSIEIDPLSDADYEWLLVLEDAAYHLRYREIISAKVT